MTATFVPLANIYRTPRRWRRCKSKGRQGWNLKKARLRKQQEWGIFENLRLFAQNENVDAEDVIMMRKIA